MARNKTAIVFGSGGLGRTTEILDGIGGLVAQGVDVPGTLEYNTPYELLTIDDAKALGITKSYDTTNGVYLYGRLERWFTKTNNQKLHFMLVPRSVSMTQIFDKANNYAAKLLRDAGGEIKLISVALNPVAEGQIYDVTINDGGSGHAVDDVLTATDGDGTIAMQVTVTEVNAGAITKVRITNYGTEYTVAPTAFSSSGAGIDHDLVGSIYAIARTNGFNSDFSTAVPKAKELWEDEISKFRNAEIFLEARDWDGSVAGLLLLNTFAAQRISIVLGQDLAVSNAIPNAIGGAAVVDFMADVARIPVSQNAGEENEELNLVNEANGWWLTPGFSGGYAYDSFNDTQLDAIHDAHYIFANRTPDVKGYHWNDTFTCASDDDGDYLYIEGNRTISKAVLEARKKLVVKMKSRFEIDPETGFLLDDVIDKMSDLALEPLKDMEAAGDIIANSSQFYMNPAQNLLQASNIDVEIDFVPVPIGRNITIKMSFRNPFNN